MVQQQLPLDRTPSPRYLLISLLSLSHLSLSLALHARTGGRGVAAFKQSTATTSTPVKTFSSPRTARGFRTVCTCRPSPSNASAAVLLPSASASAAPSRADLLQLVPALDLKPVIPVGPRLAGDTPSPSLPCQVPRRRRPPLFLPRPGGDARSAASLVLTAAARDLLCPGPLLAPRSSPAASSCSPASPTGRSPWVS